jgi:EAL domain-containing protein (putative c-di-GMP-specific phosphodiesterase class I)
VELGRALGLEMVAEGIETAEQARWFRSLGCQFGQGFYFAEPMSAADADTYLAEHRGDARGEARGKAVITRLDSRRRRGEAAS